jgi:hypothetical protein
MHHSACAHGAWFERDVELAIYEAVVADRIGCRAHGHDLGVRRRVYVAQDAILSPGDDLAVRDHDCANGNLTRSRGKLRLFERGLHKDFVLHRVYVTDLGVTDPGLQIWATVSGHSSGVSNVLEQNLKVAAGFQPYAAEEMDALRKRSQELAAELPV